MNRLAETLLTQWITSENRKALIIRGARQVGKSTLVRHFAQKRHLPLFEVNLEQHSAEGIWNSFRAETIIKELELAMGQRLVPGMLLFIDEIQACPKAIQALRYLVEERPDLPVIAAGSLLEFTLGEALFSMPVGRVQFLHLGPMTFSEVLEARGEELLATCVRPGGSLSADSPAHERLKGFFREYLFTGGMPEAVLASIGEKSVLASRQVHRNLVAAYQTDFGKYQRRIPLSVLERVFHHVPLHLGEKFRYVSVSRDIAPAGLKAALQALVKARLVLPAWHSHGSGIPLRAGMREEIFKVFFLDVGLAAHLSGLDWQGLSADGALLLNRGALVEQFAAQHLAVQAGGLEMPELYYWLREGKSTNAEVDFLLKSGERVLPVEVKAGKSGSLRSLHQFVAHTHATRALRFDLNPPSTQQVSTTVQTAEGTKGISFELESQPVYMVERWG